MAPDGPPGTLGPASAAGRNAASLDRKEKERESRGRAKRPFLSNALLALAAPLLFFGLVELILVAAGVGVRQQEGDPYVGFEGGGPLFIPSPRESGGARMITAPAKLEFFQRQSFAPHKPPGTYRIFCLGGSTTYGRPYTDATSFCGWLRELLPAADSTRLWEVINAGGISYASYRIARLVRELVAFEPDLFIVYSGHNEFLEERTYRSVRRIPRILRETDALLSTTRSYSLLKDALTRMDGGDTQEDKMGTEVATILEGTIGPTSYVRDDSLRARILEHYRHSLHSIVETARGTGARTLLVTTPSNLADCAPFKSQFSVGGRDSVEAANLLDSARALEEGGAWQKALEATLEGSRLDPRHAGLAYAAGKALMKRGRYTEAESYLQRARDEDICPLRAPTEAIEAIRQTAALTQAPLVDFERMLRSRTRSEQGHPIPGDDYFFDHVHLTIDTHRMLALAIIDKLKEMDVVHPGENWGPGAIATVEKRVREGLDRKANGVALHQLAKVLNWAGKHEDAARVARRALALDTCDLEAIYSSLYVGAALERKGHSDLAIPHYQRAFRLDSNNQDAYTLLMGAYARQGFRLEKLGMRKEAIELYARALRDDPGNPIFRRKLQVLLTEVP